MKESVECRILNILREKGEMKLADISTCFPSLDYHTIAWYLNRCVKRGNVVKTSRASYAPAGLAPVVRQSVENLPQQVKDVMHHLEDLDYTFCISGLDCFRSKDLSFDGEFPTIICVTPDCTSEIQMELMREYDLAVRAEDIQRNWQFDGTPVRFYILPMKNQSLFKDHMACPEKAFCDLYFCITRMGYPLDLSNLVTLLRHTDINRSRFLSSSKEDGISDEVNFVAGYRPDFLIPFADYVKTKS